MCDADDIAFSVELNNFRVNSGIRAMPISSSLVTVARAHGASNPPGNQGHDWDSDPSGGNRWQACSYDPGTDQGCMTNKAKEVTGGVYTGNSYEISRQGGRPIWAWDSSYSHEIYMMNSGGNMENALGCSRTGFTSCWLSSQPEGTKPNHWGLCKATSKRNRYM